MRSSIFEIVSLTDDGNDKFSSVSIVLLRSRGLKSLSNKVAAVLNFEIMVSTSLWYLPTTPSMSSPIPTRVLLIHPVAASTTSMPAMIVPLTATAIRQAYVEYIMLRTKYMISPRAVMVSSNMVFKPSTASSTAEAVSLLTPVER